MNFFWLTIKTTFKDRIFIIIFSLILVYCFIPVFSYFSLRQIQEVSITSSLTLNSFLLLFLSLFGGIATIWRDIERRYSYILLTYPITRNTYLLGRFCGFASILLIIALINFFFSTLVIKISASMYKSSLPILWQNIFIATFFSFLKYCLLMAFGFFFSTFSTSFFTPFFSTISIFIIGNASQGIYDYIINDAGEKINLFIKKIVILIYYVLPNFSSFDFTIYAAYSLPINPSSLFYSFIYWLIYICIILFGSLIIFNKRDLS